MNEQDKCGAHSYLGYDQARVDKVLATIRDKGMTVNGSNPWEVDSHRHGVKLRGAFDTKSGEFSIVVTDKDFYVPCGKIWEMLDPILQQASDLD